MADGAAVRSEGDRILDVVVDVLEHEGYDAVQLRVVARRARTSLATIYKRYPTRDDLILAALEYWMERHRYAGVTLTTQHGGASLQERLMCFLGASRSRIILYYQLSNSKNSPPVFGMEMAPLASEAFSCPLHRNVPYPEIDLSYPESTPL